MLNKILYTTHERYNVRQLNVKECMWLNAKKILSSVYRVATLNRRFGQLDIMQ